VTAGVQCDNCRLFGPQRAPGWFCVAQQPDEEAAPSVISVLFGLPEQPLTFCTIKCLADWAYVRNAAAEAAASTEAGQ
jgi:hypothetical protein